MRIAVLSDIHGNVCALDEVLKDIKKQNIDTIICLGDLVGYGPFPNEVVETIKKEKILSIVGNYDSSVMHNNFDYIRDTDINKFFVPWTRNILKNEYLDFLKSLPNSITIDICDKKLTFVHGSIRSINEYLKEDSKEANEVMELFKEDILFCGHTHIPYKKQYNDKLLVNVGSVGKPKMGMPKASYVIVDISKNNCDIETKIIEYDYTKVVLKMQEYKFPKSSIDTIKTGIE